MSWLYGAQWLVMLSTPGLYIIIIYICYRQYQSWHYSPLRLLGLGLFIMLQSTSPDIICRFAPATELLVVDPLIRLSGVLFFVGSFLVLVGFLTTQSSVPWW